MPSLGADMDAGTLLEWHVKPGDTVKRGDIVALVDTSKAEIEVEIFEDGVVDQLLVAEGSRVPVGTVLATLRATGAQATASPPSPAAAPSAPRIQLPDGAAPVTAPQVERVAPPETIQSPAAHRIRVSPLARRAAERLCVDLAAISGTGPRGAITLADVERSPASLAQQQPTSAVQPPVAEITSPLPPPSAPVAPLPATENADRQDAMRHAIGALMARSKHQIPHYYLQLEIDLSSALSWLHESNAARPIEGRVLPSALLLSAVAHAAAEMPEMNGFWIDDAFTQGPGVHLGVAVSLRGGGLIAPALHDADRKTLDELMTGVRDLVQRARAGRLRSSEMSDPTLTVTNLGERGVDLVHGVIYPPQVALVGFGAVRDRPWAVAGMLGVRPTVIATLAADHRASDGHSGGLFLNLVDQKLQKPEAL